MNGINRVRLDIIFNSVRDYVAELLLPDQDIFKYLYGAQTMPLEDVIWNYDARYFSDYLLRSKGGEYTMTGLFKTRSFFISVGKETLDRGLYKAV